MLIHSCYTSAYHANLTTGANVLTQRPRLRKWIDHRDAMDYIDKISALLDLVVTGDNELLAERGVDVDHVTIFRWVQRFTPILIDAARPCRDAVGGRWFVDESYVKVAGRWRYVYRAIDEHGHVIDVFVSPRRDIAAARRFFRGALAAHGAPDEVITELAQVLRTVIEELIGDAFHNTEQYANNRVECDHGRLKARLRPMRGLKTGWAASVVVGGHAFMQNLRRGHYELGVEARTPHLRVAAAFDDLAAMI